jgi:DNA invertase Pin-like site-specific DNA recombinase
MGLFINVQTSEHLHTNAQVRFDLEPYVNAHPLTSHKDYLNMYTKKDIIAVGYVRVSTKGQDVNDDGLEVQAKKIRKCCAKRGFHLEHVYKDVATGVGSQTTNQRPGLQAAILGARKNDSILIVTDPSRLFRDLDRASEFFDRDEIKVFSIKAGKFLTKKRLLNEIAHAEHVAANIRAGTSDALQALKKDGKVLGSKGDKSAANIASARARQLSSLHRVETYADIISEDLTYLSLSHKEFAALLNRRELLTPQGKLWSADNVVRTHKMAKELYLEQQQLERDLDAEDALKTTNVIQLPASIKMPSLLQTELQSEISRPMTDEEKEDAEMVENDPIYGMF